MKRKLLSISFIVIILCLVLYFSNGYKVISSTITSYVTTADDKYILEQGEWVGQHYGIISLYDKTDSISNNIIYRQNKPVYKVKRLNKYFNEMTVLRFDENKTDVFTSTEESTN